MGGTVLLAVFVAGGEFCLIAFGGVQRGAPAVGKPPLSA